MHNELFGEVRLTCDVVFVCDKINMPRIILSCA